MVMKKWYHVETKKECTTTLIMQHYIQHEWDELNSQYIHKGVYQYEQRCSQNKRRCLSNWTFFKTWNPLTLGQLFHLALVLKKNVLFKIILVMLGKTLLTILKL
jgi:hypothetical protein